MDIYNLSPFYFYKVIEVVIRAEEGLSRDVVKHLNHVSCGKLLNYCCIMWFANLNRRQYEVPMSFFRLRKEFWKVTYGDPIPLSGRQLIKLKGIFRSVKT